MFYVLAEQKLPSYRLEREKSEIKLVRNILAFRFYAISKLACLFGTSVQGSQRNALNLSLNIRISTCFRPCRHRLVQFSSAYYIVLFFV
jgi:hypothetical protein